MTTATATLDTLREQHEALRLQSEIVDLERSIQLADIENRMVLRESDQWGELVNRREYLSDTPGFGFGAAYDNRIANPSDRKGGKCTPIFENEQDLAWIRGIGRFIADHYEIAIGALENLTGYTIGTGFTYEVKSKRKSQANEQLIAAVQEAIDETAEANSWTGDLEDELFRRSRKEGEFFLWIRENGLGPATFTLVDPGFVTEPADPRTLEDHLSLEGLCWTFGIATDQGDVERRHGYFIQRDGDPADWEFAPANRMVHCRLNVDRGIKRGVSDFYAAYQNLERASKLLSNTLQGAAIQASIAFIREHVAGTAQSTIESFARTKADSTSYATKQNGGVKQINQQKYLPGKVIDTAGTKYHAGPLGQSSAPTYIDVMQAGLRIVGARWTMPEYMVSGDASNANYSSTLVAGGPFDRATKRRQAFYERHFTAAFWAALGIYCRQGRFTEYGINTVSELKQIVEVTTEAPGVAVQDDAAQEVIRETRFRNGILSRRTWAAQADLDFDNEVAEGAKPEEVGIPGQAFGQPGAFGQQPNPKQTAVAAALESVQTTEEARAILMEAYP